MFDIFESLTKAVVGVVTLPVDVAADIVTLGGNLTNKEEPYTCKKIKKIMDNIDDATS